VPAPPPLEEVSDVGIDEEEVARESVVRIRAVGACGVGVGSGFVVEGGRIVTNRHVVQGARTFDVQTWDGEPVAVGGARQGRATDLAVIDLQPRAARRFEPLVLARRPADVGDALTALGYAEAGPAVATHGQLIDLPNGRRFGEPGQVLRMTANVRPGNSGGPVLTDDLRVAGVVYAYEVATQYALAIPLPRVRDALDDPGAFEPVRPC
jgi:S1-C subfamily serine protease